jgi:hypothetical protein
MNIAIINAGQVQQLGDYRALFPQTSFPPSGPSDEFLTENSALRVNAWKPHDAATQKLVACPPYIDGDWAYTVQVEPLTQDDIDARNQAQAANVRADRNRRLADCDWTQLSDAPVDPLPWQTYRQALRDVTEQDGFPSAVIWPEAPAT